MLRDVYVDTFRNGTDWQLSLHLLCETSDVGTIHRGTWTIKLMDDGGQSIQELISTAATIYGNQEREAVVRFQMKIPSDQVWKWCWNILLSIEISLFFEFHLSRREQYRILVINSKSTFLRRNNRFPVYKWSVYIVVKNISSACMLLLTADRSLDAEWLWQSDPVPVVCQLLWKWPGHRLDERDSNWIQDGLFSGKWPSIWRYTVIHSLH